MIQVKSITEFCFYYNKIVKTFAEIDKPLHRLSSEGLKFTWQKEHQKELQLLKMRVLHASILAFPNVRHSFLIDTDASYTALGSVLLQLPDGHKHQNAFESRVLSKKETNEATTKREARGTYKRCVGSVRIFMIRNVWSESIKLLFIGYSHKMTTEYFLDWLKRFKNLSTG